MQTWGVVFLGVIALASLLQGVFLVALMLFGRRLSQRLDAVQERIDRDVTPALENFARVSRAAAEIADLAALQARRVDLLLADTVEKIEQTTSLVQEQVIRPLKPIASLLAFLKGLQRGIDVLLQVRGKHGEAGRRRGREDDEHLFI